MNNTNNATTNQWATTRLAGALGGEVRGVNLAQVSPGEVDQIKQLLQVLANRFVRQIFFSARHP